LYGATKEALVSPLLLLRTHRRFRRSRSVAITTLAAARKICVVKFVAIRWRWIEIVPV
jgi:hypothetical protein